MDTGYCTTADLLIDKSTPLPVSTDKGHYIQAASSYMNSRLAIAFPTPIVLDPDLAAHAADAGLLRTICVHLASGSLILAVTAGSERHSLHAYGKYLVERGEMLLQQLIDGTLDLTSVPRVPSSKDVNPAGPLVGHGTSFNMTDGYYHNFEPYGFTPGRTRPDEEGDWPFNPGYTTFGPGR